MKHRKVLLAVTGLSPQIITETLYALAVAPDDKNRFIPDEIQVVTTSQGRDRIQLLLLSEKPGWFRRMIDDFNLPEITFNRATIHTVTDAAGSPLDDIRSAGDNTRVADTLTQQIAGICNDPATALHVSIAGGRKTMGFFAGYALSLFARPQDRLSHALVSSDFESHPEFFYPTPYEHVIIGRDANNTPLDARQAKIELGEIPIVRLREELPNAVLSGDSSYSEAVTQTQQSLQTPAVHIDMAQHKLFCGGIEIRLAPRDFAFYLLFARRLIAASPDIAADDQAAASEYESLRKDLYTKHDPRTGHLEKALQTGMTPEYFRSCRTKTNNRIIEILGKYRATPYLIQSHGPNNAKRYALALKADAVSLTGDTT